MAGKRLTGKFTDEEYELIKQIQEKEKINNNQLVRGGVNFLIQISLVKDFLNNSGFGKLMKPLGKDMDKYVNSPVFQKKLEKMAKKIGTKEIAKIEEEAKHVDKRSKILTKKKKVGRPKKKKSKKMPGRPKGS